MGLVIIAGFYMAWNIGANDVANAMGTSVGSGALTLRQAVLVAAVLEFSGAFFFGSAVSETIQTGIIDPNSFASQPLTLACGMLACLIAAGVWLQIASYYGWPVSTTHTIVGAVIGFGLVFGGTDAIQWNNVSYIASSWLVSPLLGGVLAFLLFSLLKKVIFRAKDPIGACKRIAPVLVAMMVAIVLPMLLFSHSGKYEPSFLQGVFICLASGAISAYLSLLALRRTFVKGRSAAHPQMVVMAQMESAQHALLQATPLLPLSMQEKLCNLTEEIDNLKHEAKLQLSESVPDTHAQHMLVEKVFGFLQIMSACMMAFAHGTNDVSNAIGPLAAAISILQNGKLVLNEAIPTWVFALGASGIVIGLATWGWRVIETIGKKITELTPTRGFAAEFGTALTIILASRLGMPVSTTHTLVGAVIGVGIGGGMGALNLNVAKEIFISWVVTIPAGAGITIFFYYLISTFVSV